MSAASEDFNCAADCELTPISRLHSLELRWRCAAGLRWLRRLRNRRVYAKCRAKRILRNYCGSIGIVRTHSTNGKAVMSTAC